ncbi:MAG TPA: LLM class F420-dependent oxidoreductase [Microbacteriaceae bacterium]|nr:LLM class F420-dependent oxidoreductase [Microbacteriaceae bacterium]
MEIGLHFMNFSVEGGADAIPDAFAAAAIAADEHGLDRLTVMDHWFQMERFAPATEPMLEAYTALGFAAGLTKRIKLGALVTGVTYRWPALLVKTATTLDVLSRGRSFFGIGAAWYEREHVGLGVPYPPIAERFQRLEELIEIAQQMWSQDDGPFAGEFTTLAETICRPAPPRGRIPILIGGGGERKTLRLVARYADEANLFADEPEVLAHKLDVLRGHCADVGRDPDEIRITVLAGGDPVADPIAFVERMKPLADLGATQVQVRNPTSKVAEWVARLGEEVVPKLGSL